MLIGWKENGGKGVRERERFGRMNLKALKTIRVQEKGDGVGIE